jgi:hypothetical protein
MDYSTLYSKIAPRRSVDMSGLLAALDELEEIEMRPVPESSKLDQVPSEVMDVKEIYDLLAWFPDAVNNMVGDDFYGINRGLSKRLREAIPVPVANRIVGGV